MPVLRVMSLSGSSVSASKRCASSMRKRRTTCVDRGGRSRQQGIAPTEGTAHRHVVPRADIGRVRRRSDLRARAGRELPRDLHGNQASLGRLTQRGARVHGVRARIDGHSWRSLHLRLRLQGRDCARLDVRQIGRLVRQRVGLLEQTARPCALDQRALTKILVRSWAFVRSSARERGPAARGGRA